MSERDFDLQEYMTNGVENIVKGALKATLSDPQESLFMMQYAAASKKASKRRAQLKEEGENIPPFLIASITSSCNLHCAGCYSRANHACSDEASVSQLTGEEWKKIFLEARDLGIGFILLAGGEPLLRKDVIDAAGTIPEILFPIFTNGTMIGDSYLEVFGKHRNLVPVISIEGHEEKTDGRRGEGMYNTIQSAMRLMREKNVLFGTSVTVTRENIEEVTSDEFVETLKEAGTKVIFYVEFVPVTPEAADLAPGDEEREYTKKRLADLRAKMEDVVFVSFPGDEKTSGGCLAAGRGFFHINSHGGAEPCPFSPYSDINVRDTSVREALHSRLFDKLRIGGTLLEDHAGGCVLFERRETVEALMEKDETSENNSMEKKEIMTIEQAMNERHSVRNYQDKAIDEETVNALNELIEECNREGNLHIQLLTDAGNTFNRFLSKAMGLASAPSVIACVGPDDDTLDERIGYYGEKIVIRAQQLGLNTCWAGTYNKKSVEAEINTGERLAIVIAIGYGVNNGRPHKSKSISAVIRGNETDMPEWFIDGVKMALLAPTAVNQQKFEFVLKDDGFEVVDKGGIMSKIDKGIVKYHFEIGSGK